MTMNLHPLVLTSATWLVYGLVYQRVKNEVYADAIEGLAAERQLLRMSKASF